MENLAFIVLNYNCYKDTKKCVEQLQSFNKKFKIVIVDNMSTDNSFGMLKNSNIENENTVVIQSDKNGGYSYGNNFGIKFAEKNYNIDTIAVINPDVIIPKYETIEKMYSYLYENEKYAMIGGMPLEKNKISFNLAGWNIPSKKNVVLDRSLFLKSKKQSSITVINDNLAKIDCIAGCFFMAKLNIFKEIGYFDDNVFLYNEENILGIKLKKAGYINILALNLTYYHNHDYSKDAREYSLKKKMNMLKSRYQSRKYLIEKYYTKNLVPCLYLVEVINALKISAGHVKNKVIRGVQRG